MNMDINLEYNELISLCPLHKYIFSLFCAVFFFFSFIFMGTFKAVVKYTKFLRDKDVLIIWKQYFKSQILFYYN